MGISNLNKEISPETLLQRKSDLLFNKIDEEVVMLSVENSEYYGINPVGSRIWDLLEKPLTFKNLISKLMEEYNVPEKQCINETISFLNDLYKLNLI